jgi:spermidine/putrescine transport system permease protein
MKASLRVGPLVLTAPAVAGLLVFFIAPLVAFGVYSFLTGSLYDVKSPLTVENYREVFETDINRTLGRNSLVVGLLAAGFSVLIALPMAYWLRYSAGRWRGIVLFLIVASFLASYLVRIFAWRSMLGRNGAINRGLESIGLIDEPLNFLLYNRFAVTVALVHIFLPYVVLVLYAGLAPLQPAYLETAQDLGAGRVQRWRRVVLPLVAAPAVSAFLFVFVLSAADYVTPQLLGGTSGGMLGVQVQVAFIGTGDFAYGAALAFAMLAGFVLCYALIALGLRLTKLDKVRFAA